MWRGNDAEDSAKRLDGFFRIAMALTSDFASMLMIDAMEGNQYIDRFAAGDRIYSHKDYKAWSEKHGAAMKKHFSI